MSKALALIDLQNDYFPGGRMELVGATEAVERAAGLLEAFRRRSLPVIHIQHLATRASATFFVPGTPGVEIHAAVRPRGSERVASSSTSRAASARPTSRHRCARGARRSSSSPG